MLGTDAPGPHSPLAAIVRAAKRAVGGNGERRGRLTLELQVVGMAPWCLPRARLCPPSPRLMPSRACSRALHA